MTKNATSKAVATPPGEPTERVELSDDDAKAIKSDWDANTASLSELKTKCKRAIKREAREILDETDWIITRNQEQAMRGQSQQGLPQTVADHRDEVRRLEGQAMDDIDAADTKDAVRAVTVDWPDPPEPPL